MSSKSRLSAFFGRLQCRLLRHHNPDLGALAQVLCAANGDAVTFLQ